MKAPTKGAAIKQGRAAVLLAGEATPISFKLMNLKMVLDYIFLFNAYCKTKHTYTLWHDTYDFVL